MKRKAWLLVAVLLIAIAAFFMSRGDRALHAKSPPLVEFPRHASPEEHEAVLAASAGVYGGYLKYQGRIAHRRLRIFLIETA